jgi:hypothetical protein
MFSDKSITLFNSSEIIHCIILPLRKKNNYFYGWRILLPDRTPHNTRINASDNTADAAYMKNKGYI